jgi:hypothetical protein
MLPAFRAVKQFLMRMSLFSREPHNTQNTYFPAEKQHEIAARLPPIGLRLKRTSVANRPESAVFPRPRAEDLERTSEFRGLGGRKTCGDAIERQWADRFSFFAVARRDLLRPPVNHLNSFADRYRSNFVAKNLFCAAHFVANRFDALRADLLIMSLPLSRLLHTAILKGEKPLKSLG